MTTYTYDEPLLTSAEVADRIGMTPRTVTHYARTGRIKAVRTGKVRSPLRFTEQAVDDYLNRLQHANQ